MPRIAQCPVCNMQIAVPSDAGESALLRCPLCDVEFGLEDIIATTLQEAVLLETSVADNFLDFEDSEPDDVDPGMATEEKFDFLDDDEDDASKDIAEDAIDDIAFEDVTDEVIDDLVDEEETAANIDDVAADEGGDDFVMEIPVEEPEETRPWNFGESSDEPQHVAVEPVTSGTAVATSMASRAASLRKPKKSFLRNIVNYIGGGVVGLALGYFVLLWIGGPDRDFLELGKKLPAWMTPTSFNGSPVIAKTSTTTPKPTTSTRRQPQRGFADLANEPRGKTPNVMPEVFDTTPDVTTPEAVMPTDLTPEDTVEVPASPFDGLDDEPVTPVVLGLRDVQPMTTESLDAALDAARAAMADLLDGNLTDKASRPKKGRSYITFCALAETMTQAADAMATDATVDSPDTDLLPRLDAAKQAIAKTIVGEKTLGEVGTIGRIWLGKERRTNQGIIAVGQVLGTYDCAPYAGLLLELEGVPSTVPVVSTRPLPHREGDRIVVVGLIVDTPADNLSSFPKTPPQVIYAGQIFGAK